jgi:hypothetical protein
VAWSISGNRVCRQDPAFDTQFAPVKDLTVVAAALVATTVQVDASLTIDRLVLGLSVPSLIPVHTQKSRVAPSRGAGMVRQIETAIRAEVTDNKLSSTAVAADLITQAARPPHGWWWLGAGRLPRRGGPAQSGQSKDQHPSSVRHLCRNLNRRDEQPPSGTTNGPREEDLRGHRVGQDQRGKRGGRRPNLT